MNYSAAAAAAAGWLLSPFLNSLSDRIRSCADDLFRYLPSGSASADLERLVDYIVRLSASASAVERARCRPLPAALLAWLNRLKDAADDADPPQLAAPPALPAPPSTRRPVPSR